MSSSDYNAQAADIHEYIVKTIGHKWRLVTWKKKYVARLRNYGYKKCIVAIDGFFSQKWWMENKSADAPECIFRSDKSFERFLAAGEKVSVNIEAERKEKREHEERELKSINLREKLEHDNADLTARMLKKLSPLRDEIHEQSWRAWIDPLLFVAYDSGTIILFSEYASYVQEYYLKNLEDALGVPVTVTSDPKGVLEQ